MIENNINTLFQQYLNNKCKLWNIDTSIWNSWKRFHKNLHETLKNKSIKNLEIFCKNKKNNEFNLRINGINLEPNSKKTKEGWSVGAMRQFLQVGNAFGFWGNHSKKLSKLINNQKISIDISSDFLILLNKNFDFCFVELLIESMKNALNAEPSHIKNLGFTLFACFIKDKKINKFYVEKIKNKNGGKIFETNSQKYINYIDKILDETFLIDKKRDKTSVVEKIIKFYKFNEIVNLLYSYLDKKKRIKKIKIAIPKDFSKEEEKILSIYDKFIEDERVKLRQNIIDKRVKEIKIYNDLENVFPKNWYIDDCDAAHILNIWQIKQRVITMIKKKEKHDVIEKFIINTASNSNNGILLLKHWHYYFDKNLFKIGINGKFIFLSENNKRLETLNIGNKIPQIKKEVLNEEMAKFLKMRQTTSL